MIKIEIDDVTVYLHRRRFLSIRVSMFNESDSLFPCIVHSFIKNNVTWIFFFFFCSGLCVMLKVGNLTISLPISARDDVLSTHTRISIF